MKETTTVSKILAAMLVTSHILCICDKSSIPNKGTKSKFAHITPNNNKNTPFITKFYIHSHFTLSGFNVKEVIDKMPITQNI